MLDACRTPDAGCWILDARYWLANNSTRMNMTHWLGIIGVGGGGVAFVGLALQARKQGKKWGVMFSGGVLMLLLVALSLLFGFSL
jgi:hypothetical protein